MVIVNMIETKTTRAVVGQEGGWYSIDAWARGSDRESWRQVWCGRTSRSYLYALNMANDTGLIKEAYQTTLNFAN